MLIKNGELLKKHLTFYNKTDNHKKQKIIKLAREKFFSKYYHFLEDNGVLKVKISELEIIEVFLWIKIVARRNSKFILEFNNI